MLTEAGRFETLPAAAAAQGALAAEGIESVLFDSQMAGFDMTMLFPVRLMVLDEDLAAARAILAA